MAAFKGKAPGSGSGEMSRRTVMLRPHIGLTPAQQTQARRLRRGGAEPEAIAEALSLPFEEVEKALLQMRSPRPETTRGTLNVTLAAHKLIMKERVGDEPIWQTMDRMLDELLRLRTAAAPPRRRPPAAQDDLPLLQSAVQPAAPTPVPTSVPTQAPPPAPPAAPPAAQQRE